MLGAILLFEDEFVHVVAISFTALILTELLMVALAIRTWHWLMVAAEFVSLFTYAISVVVMQSIFGEYLFAYKTFLRSDGRLISTTNYIVREPLEMG